MYMRELFEASGPLCNARTRGGEWYFKRGTTCLQNGRAFFESVTAARLRQTLVAGAASDELKSIPVEYFAHPF
jgi:hypothetical protein